MNGESMPYTAFISYNTTPEEQVFIYRLQTLALASDISVLLPQRNGHILSNETKTRINGSNVVLAFLTAKLTPEVREELGYAQGKGKLIIPIYETGVRLTNDFKQQYKWIEYNPDKNTPGDIERKVVEMLKELKKEKQNKDVVLLTVLGIGLLALIASNK